MSPEQAAGRAKQLTTAADNYSLGGILSSGGAGTKTLNGPILLSASNITVSVGADAPLIINGIISGSVGFNAISFNTLTLNASNIYTGTTTVSGGTLLVNGFQPGSPIVFLGDILGGTGTVGTITVSDSFPNTLAPGVGVLAFSTVAMSL